MSVKSDSVLRSQWQSAGEAGKHYRVKNDGRGKRISNIKSYNQLRSEQQERNRRNRKRVMNYMAYKAIKGGKMSVDTYMRRRLLGFY